MGRDGILQPGDKLISVSNVIIRICDPNHALKYNVL